MSVQKFMRVKISSHRRREQQYLSYKNIKDKLKLKSKILKRFESFN